MHLILTENHQEISSSLQFLLLVKALEHKAGKFLQLLFFIIQKIKILC